MTEVTHKSFARQILDSDPPLFSAVYLIFGEPYLCRKSCQILLDALVPEKKEQERCIETAEYMDPSQIADLLEQLNTYSFFSSRRIIVLRNAAVFSSSRNRPEPVQKIKKAYDTNDMEKAAKLFLGLLAQVRLSLDEAGGKTFAEKFSLQADQKQGLEWIDSLADYCRRQNFSVPEATDDASLLQRAIKRGFPKNHHLLLIADAVDKRTALYKTIKADGVVIDCSVAKGARKQDREIRQQIIREQAGEMLDASGKKMAPKALDEIHRLIGFDLNALSRAIEKLEAYTGDRRVIEIADVRAVLSKSREEPVYELTGALSDKNSASALRLLEELLESGYHYLQILMAITNQVRRLLLVKAFISSSYAKRWQPRMPYEQFKNRVIPMIQEYDAKLLEETGAWFSRADARAADSRKKAGTELLVARQPNNPYPIYQQFLKASNFSEMELRSAMKRLHEADVALKTTGRVPEFVLQETILAICAGMPE